MNSFQSSVHQLLDIHESIIKVHELIVNIANNSNRKFMFIRGKETNAKISCYEEYGVNMGKQKKARKYATIEANA